MELKPVILPVQVNQRWGFIDEAGRWIVQPQYGVYRQGEAGQYLGFGQGHCHYLSAEGQILQQYETSFARPFQKGWAAVLIKDRFWLLDRQFNCLFKLPTGLLPLDMGQDLVVIQGDYTNPRDGIWGAANRQGKVVLPFDYGYLALCEAATHENSATLLIAAQQGLYGALDEAGRWVIPCRYEQLWNFRQDRAFYQRQGYWGVVTSTGDELTEPIFPDEALWGDFSESELTFRQGFAVVWSQGRAGFINRQGQQVTDFMYEEAQAFREARAAVKIAGRWGFVDTRFRLVIPAQWAEVGYFSQGAAAVRQGQRWGYIDRDGSWLLKPQFEKALPFQGGFAYTLGQGKVGYVNRQGQEIFSISV